MTLLFAAFIALVTSAHNGTRNYEECKAVNFEPKSCFEAKQLYKSGKYLCSVQGKPFSGSSDCK